MQTAKTDLHRARSGRFLDALKGKGRGGIWVFLLALDKDGDIRRCNIGVWDSGEYDASFMLEGLRRKAMRAVGVKIERKANKGPLRIVAAVETDGDKSLFLKTDPFYYQVAT